MKNLLFALILFLVGIYCHDGNGHGYDGNCETVYTTTTIYDPAPSPSTFIYTTTTIVAGDSANIVTKTVNKPQGVVVVTFIKTGETKTISFYSTTKTFIGATTTKTSTTTVTTFPYATATTIETEIIVVSIKGTLTVTHPPPVITIASISRYTGAPTSLWLSVI